MTIAITYDRDFKPWLACSKEKTGWRPVLTGVYVDPRGLLVSSNGFGLTAIPCKIDGDLPAGVIVPAEIVKQASKWRPRGTDPAFTIDGENASAPPMVMPLVTGQYPDYWRIIPRGVSEPAGVVCFNAKELATLGDAIGEPFPSLRQNKPTDPIVFTHAGAIAVIMPTHAQASPSIEAFFRKYQESDEAAA
jgi:hypothetical protein